MSFVLVGNYGDNNVGDEALRQFFLTEFSDIDWKIVSANPSTNVELPRLPFGFRSFLSPWWTVVAAMRKSNGIVYGGGSLFTDTESVFACYMWALYAAVAIFFRKPIYLAFQGVGPFRTRRGEWVARWVYRHANFISVRDEESEKRVRSWGEHMRVGRTFDPAYVFFASHTRTPGHRKALVLIPRSNSHHAFFEAAFHHWKREHWDVIRIVLMQPGSEERRIAEKLQGMVIKAEIIEPMTVDDLLSEVSRAAFVVTQRYHGALAAIAMGTPLEVVPLTKGDKLDGLKKYVDSPGKKQELLESIRASIYELRGALSLQK